MSQIIAVYWFDDLNQVSQIELVTPNVEMGWLVSYYIASRELYGKKVLAYTDTRAVFEDGVSLELHFEDVKNFEEAYDATTKETIRVDGRRISEPAPRELLIDKATS